ncbi:MAG: saccharopine dehydrogenase family protein [Anaerolineales bacterium]
MSFGRWMLYGAYGFTGELIAEAAVRHGLTPILSGRSMEKLAPLAERLDLDPVVINLQDETRLKDILNEIDVVLNVAGPFVHTARPIIQACLGTRTSYLDVNGEVEVMEQLFALDQEAQDAGIAVIPGVGFNVLASDCLALYAAEHIEVPTHLEIATLWATEEMSPGSTKTMIEGFPTGPLARRAGKLVKIDARELRRQQRFLDGEYPILPVAIGDLVTAFRTTGIANVTTYTAFNERSANFYTWMEPVLRRFFGLELIRRMATSRVKNNPSLTEEHLRGRMPSQVWVSVWNEQGDQHQAWLETIDSYLFTAEAALLCVEALFAENHMGVLTPAQAFGADFVLKIPGTKRVEG